MDTIFNTALLPRSERARGWVAALNSTYVCLDTKPQSTEDYNGFLREARFGDVTITDTRLSPQIISRRKGHIARLDKDCFYFQFLRHGVTRVETMDRSLVANQATGTVFSASEVYDLTCENNVRSWWLEIERNALVKGGAKEKDLDPGLFSLGHGLGRLAYDNMLSLASETKNISDEVRAALGRGLIDLLVLTLQDSRPQSAETEQDEIANIRLRSVQSSIRRHMYKPGLSVSDIAALNGISAGYLHRLFRRSGMSVSDWLREERLRHSYALLTSQETRDMSITDIAFASGFSSSSHFSTSFRNRFGERPSDIRFQG